MLWLSTNNVPCTPAADQQQNLNGIDIAKFLCAILVFIIHVPLFHGELSGLLLAITFGLQHYVCRLAVPFYFVCSGYFLYRKMSFHNPDTDRMKNYCFKILRLIGTWNILLFIGWTEHLWYLEATVISVLLLGLFLRFQLKYSRIWLLACLLYLVGLLGDSYYGLAAPLRNIAFFKGLFEGYEFTFGTTRNGVFMGFIFVLLGASLSQREFKIKPFIAALGFAGSMLCLFAEVCVLKYFDIPKSYNMYLFLLPAVYFLFAFACTVRLKDGAIYRHLRSMGMLIYFLHIFVRELVTLALGALEKYGNLDLMRYLFVFTLAFTLLTAAGITQLSCKERFKWLNWLIT